MKKMTMVEINPPPSFHEIKLARHPRPGPSMSALLHPLDATDAPGARGGSEACWRERCWPEPEEDSWEASGADLSTSVSSRFR